MADNRSNILHCALQLFAARGYDAIGVQEIVETAAVTKPTLYHYFGNKQGVLEALVREGFAPLLSRLQALPAFDGDVDQMLRRITQLYFQFATEAPMLYRMQLAMWFSLPDNQAFAVIREITSAQQSLLEAQFSQFAERNGNMRGRQGIYAATFLGMLNTYIAMSLNGHINLNDAMLQQAVQQFSYGIYS